LRVYRVMRSLRSLGPWLIALSVACSSPKPQPAPEPPPAAPAAAPAPPDDSRPEIVALGDSLTAGLGVDPAEAYPAQLQRKIDAAGLRFRVVNAGVSGDTSAQGLDRLEAVRAEHPAVVIVALGANDGLRGIPVETTRSNLAAIIRKLKQDGARVVLAGMQMPPNYGPEYTTSFRALFADLARAERVAYVPFLLEGVAADRGLNQDDGIHPTARGYAIVAENVWRVLQPMLAK
jgi:acyl-CoA thioesterase-1